MAKIIVAAPVFGRGPLLDPARVSVTSEGFEGIEPTLTLTAPVQAAFAAGASRVYIDGDLHQGTFIKNSEHDYCHVRMVRGQVRATHYMTYDFLGWTPK